MKKHMMPIGIISVLFALLFIKLFNVENLPLEDLVILEHVNTSEKYIELVVHNKTRHNIQVGDPFDLEMYQAGTWEKVSIEPAPDLGWDMPVGDSLHLNQWIYPYALDHQKLYRILKNITHFCEVADRYKSTIVSTFLMHFE